MNEIDDLIEDVIVGKPQRQDAMTLLLEPIIRQRTFDAPDKVFSLGELADRDDVAGLDDETAARAVRIVLDRRGSVVKPHDIQVAVSDAATEIRHKRAKERERKAADAEMAGSARRRRLEAGMPEFEAELQRWRGLDASWAAGIEARGFLIVGGGEA